VDTSACDYAIDRYNACCERAKALEETREREDERR
jgi:hypothetical protein